MTDTENKPLTQKQAKALAALLTHQTIADAANEAGVEVNASMKRGLKLKT